MAETQASLPDKIFGQTQSIWDILLEKK